MNQYWEHAPKGVKDWIISNSWKLEEVEELDMHRLTTDAIVDSSELLTCIPTKYVYVEVQSILGARIEKLFDNSVEGWKAAEFEEVKKKDKPQFEKAAMHIIGLVHDDTIDTEELSDFLGAFVEHVISNVGCEDLDRLTVKEIVERMPDMEVNE